MCILSRLWILKRLDSDVLPGTRRILKVRVFCFKIHPRSARAHIYEHGSRTMQIEMNLFDRLGTALYPWQNTSNSTSLVHNLGFCLVVSVLVLYSSSKINAAK
jgi:hypothetical protein